VREADPAAFGENLLGDKPSNLPIEASVRTEETLRLAGM
jgi:hypothetical protein